MTNPPQNRFAVSITRGYICIGAPVPTLTYLIATELLEVGADEFKRRAEASTKAEWESMGKPPPGPPVVQLWQLIE